MVFSSAVFLFVFLPITAFVYYFSAAQVKNYVLLIASLFFYAWGEPQYILLMLLSILINWLLGLWAGRSRARERSARPAVVCAAVLNLALLFVFKYLTMPGILLSWKTFVPTFGDTSLFGFLESSPWVGWQHFTRLFKKVVGCSPNEYRTAN